MNAKGRRVPRIYKQASKTLKLVEEEGIGSLKNNVYKADHPNLKAIYALVVETVKHKFEIDQILEETNLFEKEARLNEHLGKILITEALWGKKQLPGNSKPVQVIKQYMEEIQRVLETTTTSEESTTDQVTVVWKPRYVRVNTLQSPLKKVLKRMKKDGWELLDYDESTTYEQYLQLLWDICDEKCMIDYHMKTLLVFPPKTTFYNHELYKNGTFLLQDKASCLPTYLLNPPSGAHVIDACAAPGLKTTHLAEQMRNVGCLYAVEQDVNRFKVLEDMLRVAGVTCAECIQADFTMIDPDEYENVTHILIDPSCSGSGITGRLQIQRDSNAEAHRILRLSKFQTAILSHAFRFPRVERIVYSTCSIFEEENEAVVQNVLNLLEDDFRVVPLPNEFDSWTNRGSENYSFGKHCLYASSEKDYCNGFFVVVFERVVHDDDVQEEQTENNLKRKMSASTEDEDVCNETSEKLSKKKRKKRKC